MLFITDTKQNIRLESKLLYFTCTLDTITVEYDMRPKHAYSYNDSSLPKSFRERLNELGQDFVDSVHAIENRLNFEKGSLLLVMWGESSIKPTSKSRWSSASGLIGFMASTQRSLGMTKHVTHYDIFEQLKYVEKYYQRKVKRLGKEPYSTIDVYLFTFYPVAVGKPDNFIFGSESKINKKATIAKIYRANSGLDYNRDGILTVRDFKDHIKKSRKLGHVYSFIKRKT